MSENQVPEVTPVPAQPPSTADMIAASLKAGTVADPDAFLFYLMLGYATGSLSQPQMLDGSRALYLSANPLLAMQVCQRMLTPTRPSEELDLSKQMDALSILGICAADTGDFATALQVQSRALDVANQLNDPIQQSRAWQNIAVNALYSGLFRESIRINQEAMSITSSITDQTVQTDYFRRLHTNIALAYLYLDEPSAALASSQLAAQLPMTRVAALDILNEVLIHQIQTRIHIALDQPEEAKACAARATRVAEGTKSERAHINASFAEGLTAAFYGDHDAGIMLLQQTLERAIAAKVITQHMRIAIVKALELAGRHQEAAEALKSMLQAQRTIVENNALQHVRRGLAKLHGGDENAPKEELVRTMRSMESRIELLEGRVAKEELAKQRLQLFNARIETMERLAIAAELRDDSTGEHSYRVGRIACLLAKEAGCEEQTIQMIDVAARLHDIGKISIPDHILLKPGRLNPAERAVMEMHSEIGADVLAKSEIPHIQVAEEIARFHHERWDGKGYPAKVGGQEIPLAARITALADVYDALTHERPYKQAWSIDAAMVEILSGRGTHFDPELTDLFLAMMSRLRREHANLDTHLGEAARHSPFIQVRSKLKDSLGLAAA
ncbi:MAG: HD domain-containing protein [Betaproteobacteria bacterium]|jgi:putative two-component system response regulator|nr:HD domain-containing protein [Betaproteobacteria bacterium]